MFTAHAPLSTTQISHYKEQGYLLPSTPLLSEGKFKRLKGIFEEIVVRANAGKPVSWDTPHFGDNRLFEFLMDDAVLDVVEQLIGPDFGMWSSHFISKEPKVGKATPWHEDSAYWDGRFESFDNIITIWLAIDESTKKNGCMKVIPGTHLLGGKSEYEDVDLETNIFREEIANVDESKQVYFELQPNQYSLHDSRIFHGAEANTSDRRRCGYNMR